MTRIAVLFIVLPALAFSLNLLSMNPVVTVRDIQVILNFDATPTYRFESDFSKTVFTLTLPGAKASFVGGSLPVRTGPLEMVNVISMEHALMLTFHTLVPSKPYVKSVGKTITVSFPRSRLKIDIVFTGGVDLKTAVNYLAEYLKLNVIVSPSVAGNVVDLKLTGVTPEDALRSLMMSLDNVFYSYFSDGTMFIGNYEEVSSKFAKFWGVYKAGADVVEVLKESLPEGSFINYVKNKTLLFVYGNPETHRLVASILSKRPPTIEERFDYDGVSQETVAKFLGDLRGVYGDFSYIFVPGTSQVIIRGESAVVDKVLGKLREILPPPVVKKTDLGLVVEVLDVEEASRVLNEEFGVAVERLGENRILVEGDVTETEVKETLKEHELLPESWKSITLPLYMKDQLPKIAQIAGISPDNMITMELEESMIVYIRGKPESVKYFMRLVEEFREKLRVQRWRYVKVMDVGYTGAGVEEAVKMVSDLLGDAVSITPYLGIGSIIVRATSEDVLERAV